MFKSIKSKDNNIVKHIVKLINSSSYRKEKESYVIEGLRLCNDALKSGVKIEIAVFSEKAVEKYKELKQNIVEVCESIFIFSDKLFSQISDTKTPQGIMCVCKMEKRKIETQEKGVYLGLEHIQDPSNMGTILRTAEALGVKGVIVTEDCCDIFSPKVLRGTMGAIFRVPISECKDMADEVRKMNKKNITTIATALKSDSISITDITVEQKKLCMVIIGNEGNGLKESTINECKVKTIIPMKGRAESLNASTATAISLWELFRRN